MSFALLLYLRVRCELILFRYRIRFYEKQNKVLSAKERSRKDTRLYADIFEANFLSETISMRLFRRLVTKCLTCQPILTAAAL